MMAEQFSVSRITVLLTYQRLIAEGCLATVPAQGTFVSRLPEQQPRIPIAPAAGQGRQPVRTAGRPDCRLFPSGRWRTLIREALDHLGANLAAEHADGDPALRGAIANWLSTSRGLAVDPDQIILANSHQHALHTATHFLLRPGAQVIAESPCDPRTETLIATTGAVLTRVPVDEWGLCTDLLPPGPAAMALVTPEHQRPLGSVLSEARRHALLAWATESGATVVADDVDGELRYEAMDFPPLMGMESGNRVVHLGGFSLSLGPGVDIGYLVVPCHMVAAARSAARVIDCHASRLESSALAGLLGSGAYARHLHQVRKVYLGRRDTLIRSLRQRFGADTHISGTAGGLTLVWHFPPRLGDAGQLAELAAHEGLDASPLGRATILLGFGLPEERHIAPAVARLAEVVLSAKPAVSHR